jgi:hypothetical protein
MAGGVDELDFGDVDALVDAGATLLGDKLNRPSYDVSFSSVRAVATLAFKKRCIPCSAMALSPTSPTGWEPRLKSQAVPGVSYSSCAVSHRSGLQRRWVGIKLGETRAEKLVIHGERLSLHLR